MGHRLVDKGIFVGLTYSPTKIQLSKPPYACTTSIAAQIFSAASTN